MLRRTQSNLIVFHNAVSPALEQVAINRGFEAPLWIDANTLRKQFMRRMQILPRPGERPTNLSVQQRYGLMNIDQLRAGPRAIDFMASLPKSSSMLEPTNVATLQPFRGSQGEQLRAIAAQHKWGPYWICLNEAKFRGFHRTESTSSPPAWKTSVAQLDVFNFSQLRCDADGGIDLSTVPINFRHNMLMFGTSVSEQLRNEALRRGLKYPVVASAKFITEIVGCSILPEHIAGFRLPDLSFMAGQQNRWRRGALVYNLDEFVQGGAVIEKALSLPTATVPTFAFSQQPITRQLVLEEKKATMAEGEEEVLAEELEQQKQMSKSAAPIEEDEHGLPKYKSNYWIRAFEADQLSENTWKLRPGARGAMLGDPLVRWETHIKNKSSGVASSVATTLHSDASSAEADCDVTAALGGGGGSSSSGGNAEMLPRMARLSDVPRVSENYMDGNGQLQQPSHGGGAGRYAPPSYYFDADVKERNTFLASLGCYIV